MVDLNWTQYLVTVATLAVAIVTVMTYIELRAARRQKAIKQEIQATVTQLGELLTEKLETKQNVNELKIEMARVEEQVKFLSATLSAGKSTLWQLYPNRQSGRIC